MFKYFRSAKFPFSFRNGNFRLLVLVASELYHLKFKHFFKNTKALAAKKNYLIYEEIITSAVNLIRQLTANLSRYLDQQVNILYTQGQLAY